MKNELNKIFEISECPPGDVLRKYHEDKLSGSEKHSVEKHLASCEACSDELEGMSVMPNLFSLDASVAGLKKDINTRLGLTEKKIVIPVYAKIAAVITVLFVASFIVYLTVNSNKTGNNTLSLNTSEQSSTLENILDQKAKEEEKSLKLSEKSEEAKDQAFSTKSAKIQPENQTQNSLNPSPEILDEISSSEDKLVESEQEGVFGSLSKTNKGIKKEVKNEADQNGVGAGVSNIISQSGSGKASAKTVVIDASETKEVDTKNIKVTSNTSEEIIKQDLDSKENLAENRKQQNERYKSTEEKQEQQKEDSFSREKTKDESKVKAQSDKDRKEKKRAENSDKSFALNEESGDQISKNNNITTVSDSKTKSKKESSSKNVMAASGESANMPSEKPVTDFALDLYNEGKYEEASKLFKQKVKENSADYKSLYYEGLCYYELGNDQKAIDRFEQVINFKSNEFAEEARWFMALSYIRLNNKEAARKNLNTIISTGGKRKSEAEKKVDSLK